MRKIVERGQNCTMILTNKCVYGRNYKNNRKSLIVEYDSFNNFQTNLKFMLAIKSHLQL